VNEFNICIKVNSFVFVHICMQSLDLYSVKSMCIGIHWGYNNTCASISTQLYRPLKYIGGSLNAPVAFTRLLYVAQVVMKNYVYYKIENFHSKKLLLWILIVIILQYAFCFLFLAFCYFFTSCLFIRLFVLCCKR